MCFSVNKCCCCFNLNVGTKIISVVSTILSLSSLGVYGTSAAVGSQLPPGRLLFYAVMAVTAFVQCVFGCFLIYGAFTHKPSYTIPWTILSSCLAVVLLVLTVAGSVLLSFNRKADMTAQISAVISVYFVYALILFYSSIVVSSRRHQMIFEERTAAAQALMRHRASSDYSV